MAETPSLLALLCACALLATLPLLLLAEQWRRSPQKHTRPAPVPPPPTRTRGAGRARQVVAGGGPLTAREKLDGLAEMNRLRATLSVLPPSDKLPKARVAVAPLVWDDALERQAQDWADRCPSGHRPQNPHGENLAWQTGGNVVTAVRAWDSERTDIKKPAAGAPFVFTSANGGTWCTGGWQKCGHATQQLWADTKRVGCARSTRPCAIGGYSLPLVVCNYDPPGNVENQPIYQT
jgi:hypothetical protein